jgi:hypothetical protein
MTESVHGREITQPQARLVRVAVEHSVPVESQGCVLGFHWAWQWGWPPLWIWRRVRPRKKFRVYEIRSQQQPTGEK